jgi:hypothetical protein
MSILDRMFDTSARIGDDPCDLTNRNKENIAAANYLLQNFSTQQSIDRAMNLAAQEPNMRVSGSPGGGIRGDNIDLNSRLRIPDCLSGEVGVNVQQRMFLTVPYLGRGVQNTTLENELMLRGVVSHENKKTESDNGEISHIDRLYTPLLPTIEQKVSNPANCVESIAHSGWIRGGLPSRIATRQGNNVGSSY